MPITYSPLRYPGGKTQLSKFVSNLLKLNSINKGTYIEPFAGGSGVSLQLLFENKVDHIVINDYDKSIHSIWYSIINHRDKFVDLIEKTPINIDEWHNQKKIYLDNRTHMNSVEGGFATFYLNRTNVSGIISGGPIGGQKQTGNFKIDCRFNKETSIKKINDIYERRNDITLYRKDANKLVDIIQNRFNPKNTFIFFDPPYYTQGQNLYLSFINKNKHLQLRQSIDKLDEFHWILTYDAAPQIADIYHDNNNKYEYGLNYSANTKKKATEFLFASHITKVESYDKVELFNM